MHRPLLAADRSIRRSLLNLGLTSAGLVALAEVFVSDGPAGADWVAYLTPAVGALYVASGLLAWWRRPANRVGALMTFCGVTVVASSLSASSVPELFAVGAITATVPLAVLIHLVHAFPGGEVTGRAARLTVVAGYVTSIVLQVPLWAFAPAPIDTLLVSDRPGLVTAGIQVQRWVGVAVVAATVWVLVVRLRRFGAADRTLLAGLLGFAVLAVILVPVSANVLPALGADGDAVALWQLTAVGIVPVAFLVVVLRGGFARLGGLGVFAESVASVDAAPDLDQAIGDALGDPSAVLLRWDGAQHTDRDGRVTEAGPLRSVVVIDGHDAPLGAIVHDTALGTDPVTLAAVAHMVRVALERERLAREVSESRSALERASRRVLEAGDRERRRLARDLHDGLQGSLVLLSLRARELARDLPDEHRQPAAGLADSVDGAARTLRGLVDGVLPAPLAERGLAAAVEALADELPLASRVDVDALDVRLPEPVETTAYFVIAEATTNVVKHAGATRVDIVARVADGMLCLEVSDDGVGGVVESAGRGLAGLRDRLAILAGTLEITSDASGTRVEVRLPCD